METPSEVTDYHTRLLRCSIEIEHARSYWVHARDGVASGSSEAAFNEYWFGARSMPRVKMLLSVFGERFAAFPPSIRALNAWQSMEAPDRRVVCHWHLQLADRLYREFTGVWLADRRQEGRAEVTRDRVVRWIETRAPGRWAVPTRIQFARKLLQAAAEAGLLDAAGDPRQLRTPRVTNEALTYLLYLLRGVSHAGSLADNPYLASVGIVGRELERRLRGLTALRFRKQGDLHEYGWVYEDVAAWAEHVDQQQLNGSRSLA